MFSWLKFDYFLRTIIIPIIILASILSVRSAADDVSKFVGAARNLTVEVFEYSNYGETDDTDGTNHEGLLKLNISWLPPIAGKDPVSYSIVVTSVQNESSTESIDCPEGSLYYTTKNASQLGVELPQDPLVYGIPELTVTLGCVYDIQVYANPRRNPNVVHPNLFYKVPKCIGVKCSCADAEEDMASPEVEVQRLSDDRVIVKWKQLTGNDKVKSYIIRFGVPVLISRSGLPVYNTTEIARVSANNQSFVWSNVSSNINGVVHVVAEDSNGCIGPEGSFSVISNERNNRYKGPMVIIIGSIIASVLILGSLSILWSHDRNRYEIVLSNTDTKNSHSSPVSFSRGQIFTDRLALTKRNAFYVEQEIEEAIQSGRADGLEISYSRIDFKEELGKGQFGTVYLADIDGFEATLFAVKMTNSLTFHDEVDARNQLLEEIAMMKTAGRHPHLVQLIGCCTLPANPVCAIMEYLEGGDLLTYLQNIRKRISSSLASFATDPMSACSPRPSLTETLYTTLGSEPPTTPTLDTFGENNAATDLENSHNYVNIQHQSSSQQLSRTRGDIIGLQSYEFLRFAVEIAKGMQHLEEKGITHRDLAARNILLDGNLTLKVSDFGLSKNGVYVIADGGGTRRLPVRWMSPEAMRDREFSSKSDVWSYAVVLWEIGTLGAFPYPDVRDDHILRHVVVDEKRLSRPEAISVEMYTVMQACWTSRPSDRPNFTQLLSRLLGLGGEPYYPYGKSNPCYTTLPPTEDELQVSPPLSPL
ncbi:putative molluscan insulin-related peptide(s) receptor [Neodiprion lecontei]|uniref:Molluscan insulin-related peptide(S) receptor n=1 Tax=Neodiprion lecontei TaxID=441921 RepID=A0ABM3FDX2_NEOLC|nr:putative molluscan insulin-related peptide(s) receptor [Neodiprion lecontei]